MNFLFMKKASYTLRLGSCLLPDSSAKCNKPANLFLIFTTVQNNLLLMTNFILNVSMNVCIHHSLFVVCSGVLCSSLLPSFSVHPQPPSPYLMTNIICSSSLCRRSTENITHPLWLDDRRWTFCSSSTVCNCETCRETNKRWLFVCHSQCGPSQWPCAVLKNTIVCLCDCWSHSTVHWHVDNDIPWRLRSFVQNTEPLQLEVLIIALQSHKYTHAVIHI